MRGYRRKAIRIGDVAKKLVQRLGPSYKRGMVLKVYKAKIVEAIGCAPLPVDVADLVPFTYPAPELEPGNVAIKYVSGLTDYQKQRRRSMASDIASEKLVPADPDAKNFDHPTLVVRMAPGSHWRQELHMQRIHIRDLINERLECEFLKEVKFK